MAVLDPAIPLGEAHGLPCRGRRDKHGDDVVTDRYAPFDVVVVPFPYVDRLAEKRRPALVISNRRLAVHGLIWVAMITSADNRQWSSDVEIADLKRAGLPAPSVVRPAKIACIEPGRIDRRVGRLDKAAARAVGHKVRGFLGEQM
jgi:mRNA-degrading endonuclease toxin of MazEF toxin-antitoxin module